MERAKYARGFKNEDTEDLPTIARTNGLVKLRELEGTIISSQTFPDKEGGSTLWLKIDKRPNTVIDWKYQAQVPIPAVCGHRIRVFSLKDYSRDGLRAEEILAYELSDFEGRVLTRGQAPSNASREPRSGFYDFV